MFLAFAFLYRSSLHSSLSSLVFLSLLFPYYSLVAHNISLVAPLLLLSLISFALRYQFMFSSLFSILSLPSIARFYRSLLFYCYRSSLFYRSSLIIIVILFYLYRSLLAHFIFSFRSSFLIIRQSLIIYRSSLSLPYYYRSSLISFALLFSFLVFIFSLSFVPRSLVSLFSYQFTFIAILSLLLLIVALLSLLSMFSCLYRSLVITFLALFSMFLLLFSPYLSLVALYLSLLSTYYQLSFVHRSLLSLAFSRYLFGLIARSSLCSFFIGSSTTLLLLFIAHRSFHSLFSIYYRSLIVRFSLCLSLCSYFSCLLYYPPLLTTFYRSSLLIALLYIIFSSSFVPLFTTLFCF